MKHDIKRARPDDIKPVLVRWPPRLLALARSAAGPRGLNAYVLRLVEAHLLGDEPTAQPSATTHAPPEPAVSFTKREWALVPKYARARVLHALEAARRVAPPEPAPE